MIPPEIKVVGLGSFKLENNKFWCLIPAEIIDEFYKITFYWMITFTSIFLMTFLREKRLTLPQNSEKIYILTEHKRKGVLQSYRRGSYILIPPEVVTCNLDKPENSSLSLIAWVRYKKGYYLTSLL